MKRHFLGFALILVAALPGHAESDYERELKQLQDEREKALAIAAEPINRRHQSALEALLRRATQANDLSAAIKIRDELQKIGVSSPTTEGAAGSVENLTQRLLNTKWDWFNGETLTFLPEGKAQFKNFPVLWSWKVTSAGRRMIEGVDGRSGKKFTMIFDHDLKTATIQDGWHDRVTRNVTNP